VEINEEKSRIVDLANEGSFTFLGFEYRRILGRNRKWRQCLRAIADIPMTCKMRAPLVVDAGKAAEKSAELVN
jgi:hypothetical protein